MNAANHTYVCVGSTPAGQVYDGKYEIKSNTSMLVVYARTHVFCVFVHDGCVYINIHIYIFIFMYELPAMGGRRLTLPSQPLHHASTPHRWQCFFVMCVQRSNCQPGLRRCLAPLNNYQ